MKSRVLEQLSHSINIIRQLIDSECFSDFLVANFIAQLEDAKFLRNEISCLSNHDPKLSKVSIALRKSHEILKPSIEIMEQRLKDKEDGSFPKWYEATQQIQKQII
jgi:hypothetical protein